MKSLPLLNDTWYKNGLHFKCTQCGKCCTGAPGYVWLSEEDILCLAKRFHLSRKAFLKKYTRQVGTRYSLQEHPDHYDCVFLEGGQKCKIYEDRPKQCKTFPFWKKTLKSRKTWEETKKSCEGIDHPEAPCIPYEDIQKTLN